MAKSAIKTNGNGEAETPSVATSETAKRQAKAYVTYVMPDGSEKNFPHKDAVAVRFSLADNTKRDFRLDNMGENVSACSRAQGVVTRFQRGYQALKDLDEVVQSIDDTAEDLSNDVWIELGTGEPRVTNLITAIVMALEAQGESETNPLVDGKVSSERRKAISDKLSAYSEEERKAMRERPAIAANLADIAAESAQKRAQEKRKLASQSEETLSF